MKVARLVDRREKSWVETMVEMTVEKMVETMVETTVDLLDF